MVEDAGRGWRVLCPPNSQTIVEADAIRSLIDNGFVVVAVGGEVSRHAEENGDLIGVEAVIDKTSVLPSLPV